MSPSIIDMLLSLWYSCFIYLVNYVKPTIYYNQTYPMVYYVGKSNHAHALEYSFIEILIPMLDIVVYI